jgi:hypothetical protein
VRVHELLAADRELAKAKALFDHQEEANRTGGESSGGGGAAGGDSLALPGSGPGTFSFSQ